MPMLNWIFVCSDPRTRDRNNEIEDRKQIDDARAEALAVQQASQREHQRTELNDQHDRNRIVRGRVDPHVPDINADDQAEIAERVMPFAIRSVDVIDLSRGSASGFGNALAECSVQRTFIVAERWILEIVVSLLAP